MVLRNSYHIIWLFSVVAAHFTLDPSEVWDMFGNWYMKIMSKEWNMGDLGE